MKAIIGYQDRVDCAAVGTNVHNQSVSQWIGVGCSFVYFSAAEVDVETAQLARLVESAIPKMARPRWDISCRAA